MSFEYRVGNSDFKIRNKFISAIMCVSFVLFFAGIVFSFVVDGLYSNDITDYTHTHEELKTYAPISNVAYDTDTELIYVFYQDANAVNVYNNNGEFKWSVSIPKQQNGIPSFYLENGKMYLIWYETYVYNAKSGGFIENHEYSDEEMLKSDSFEESDLLEGTNIDFDAVDVYITNKDGSAKRYIVDRPEYYILINPIVGWLVGFVNALIIGAIVIINALKSSKNRQVNIENCGKFAKGFALWYKIISIVSAVYAVANIVLLICSPIVIMHLLIPIAILFIISGWIFAFINKRLNKDEKALVNIQFIKCIIALAFAVFSTFIGALFFQ